MTKIVKFEGQYDFLSNFYEHGGWTVEHHFQAAKTDDPEWAARILGAPSPAAAKKLGRRAPLRRSWEDEKLLVMRTLLRLKFSNGDLAEKLLATEDVELVEGNWWGDTYWGVCRGQGQNWLGRLLMEVRTTLESVGG